VSASCGSCPPPDARAVRRGPAAVRPRTGPGQLGSCHHQPSGAMCTAREGSEGGDQAPPKRSPDRRRAAARPAHPHRASVPGTRCASGGMAVMRAGRPGLATTSTWPSVRHGSGMHPAWPSSPSSGCSSGRSGLRERWSGRPSHRLPLTRRPASGNRRRCRYSWKRPTRTSTSSRSRLSQRSPMAPLTTAWTRRAPTPRRPGTSVGQLHLHGK
jgi:hypothetical protein